jgi:hypothetical protein
MANELEAYQQSIDKMATDLGFGSPGAPLGIALHRVYVDGAGNASDYELSDVNDQFLEILGLNRNHLSGLRYADLFPENKETKFDWTSVLGNSSISEARTKFSIHSEITNKWYSMMSFSPKKGYALLIVEDITSQKLKEIERMVAVQASSPKSDDDE